MEGWQVCLMQPRSLNSKVAFDQWRDVGAGLRGLERRSAYSFHTGSPVKLLLIRIEVVDLLLDRSCL
jgi:hypothetical protein